MSAVTTVFTVQETFDKVALHLLTQNGRSLINPAHPRSGCAYRGACGLQCAVGVLINDEFYDGEMEHNCVTDPLVLHALQQSGVLSEDERLAELGYTEAPSPKIQMLGDMQTCHDSRPPTEWNIALREIAARFQVSTKVIDEYVPAV